jgi:hypothetical protein
MRTDDLIAAIAADGARRPASLAIRLGGGLAAGGLVAGALFLAQLGVRPDIADALQTWRFVAKLAILLVSLASALWASAQLARPDADLRKVLAALIVPVAVLGLAVAWELAASPAETWWPRAVGTNSKLCLTAITLLAIAPLAALLTALRAGAPRSPALAGAMAGLLAGSVGGVLYALHCFDDSPLFVALWYVPPIALVTLAGAAAGARLLRW